MKKYVLFLFTAWLVPWALAAQTTVASGTCGADGDNLSWALSSDGTLTINGSGAMADYGSRGTSLPPWNSYRDEITRLSLPDGLTYIGKRAFYSCQNLSSLVVPENVTEIGAGAFTGTDRLAAVVWNAVRCADFSTQPFPSTLASVTFGSKVAYIPAYLFRFTSVSEVVIPGSVEEVGAYAFSDCSSLARLQVGAGVAAVGEKAFYCVNLAQVEWNAVDCADFNRNNVAFSSSNTAMTMTIGSGVRRIPAYFCYTCKGLSSLVFEAPSSLERVEEYAFYGCPLQDYELPGSVEYVGPYAFGDADDAYLRQLTVFFGRRDETDWNRKNIDWNALDSKLVSERIVITRPEVNGKHLGDLHMRTRYGINVSRVQRSGIQLVATHDLVLRMGDRVTVIGKAGEVLLHVRHRRRQFGHRGKPGSFFLSKRGQRQYHRLCRRRCPLPLGGRRDELVRPIPGRHPGRCGH